MRSDPEAMPSRLLPNALGSTPARGMEVPMRRLLVPLRGLCLSPLLSGAAPLMPNCIVMVQSRRNARAYVPPWLGALPASGPLSGAPVLAAEIQGQVLGGGAPVVGSTVAVWAEAQDAPSRLAETQTGADGRFVLTADGNGAILYLIARGGHPSANQAGGDNSALAMMTVLGSTPPATVVVNEMTTVASVWTHNQFFDGSAIKGNALGLKIAAGNVPNFVDLESGGYGGTIQDPLNSGQTPTMASFATPASVMAGCITRVQEDACSLFFAAAAGADGPTPKDTL